MGLEIWRFIGDTPALVIGLFVFAAVVLPTTLMALLTRRPEKPSFTMDWRQRAGLAWGLFSFGAVLLIFNAPWLIDVAFLLYVLLSAAIPLLAARLGRRRWSELGALGLNVVVTLVCLPVVAWAVHDEYRAWRAERDIRSSSALGVQLRSDWLGFPAPLDATKARVLKVERLPDAVWRPGGRGGCEMVKVAAGAWRLCPRSNDGLVSRVMLEREPMARDHAATQREDIRRLLWVVTNTDDPAVVQSLLDRKRITVEWVEITLQEEGYRYALLGLPNPLVRDDPQRSR